MGRSAIGGLLACALALVLLGAVPVQPAGAQAASHTYTYGQLITFTVELPEAEGVGEVQLYLKINGTETRVQDVALTDHRAVYEQDLNAKPFPPYATLEYWWGYKDSSGTAHTTEKTSFRYEDNRYTWTSLQGTSVAIHWVAGTSALMTSALDTAETALTEARAQLGVGAQDKVDLYIYPSLPDLQSALRLSGQTWVEGMAYPELGVLLVAVTPNDDAIVNLRRTIPHELAHKVLYEAAGSEGYNAQPKWLVEGLASYFEASPDPAYALSLDEAHGSAKLLPLESLCYAFPGAAREQILAYAQSQSVVSYIEEQYGWSAVRALVAAYGDGLGCRAGVEKALGIDLSRLERDWRAWLDAEPASPSTQPLWAARARVMLSALAPWIVLLGVLMIPSLLLIIARAPRR